MFGKSPFLPPRGPKIPKFIAENSHYLSQSDFSEPVGVRKLKIGTNIVN